MKKIAKMLLILALGYFAIGGNTRAAGIGINPYGCGSLCMAQMRGFCPTCGPMLGPMTMPWGAPSPWWWNNGPLMYSNFYTPAPWYYGPGAPGVWGNYYPGQGQVFMAKPNLYLEGTAGTAVTVKLKLLEGGSNWLAAVPVHGAEGWKGTLGEKNQIQTDAGTYRYLYSDYRVLETHLQDQEGFCSERKAVVGKMAMALQDAGFNGREVADFIEYWSVKLPQSARLCVFPQDERQLDQIAALEIQPKPALVRRVLFLVQVGEAIGKAPGKFAQAPAKAWHPVPLRLPASEKNALRAREWGVGFLAAKP